MPPTPATSSPAAPSSTPTCRPRPPPRLRPLEHRQAPLHGLGAPQGRVQLALQVLQRRGQRAVDGRLQARERALAAGRPPHYGGTCRHLSLAERDAARVRAALARVQAELDAAKGDQLTRITAGLQLRQIQDVLSLGEPVRAQAPLAPVDAQTSKSTTIFMRTS